MSRPGDPGHAAAARAAASDGAARSDGTGGPDAPSSRRASGGRRLTLEQRLLLIVAGLLAAVSAVVGLVSVAVFHGSSIAAVDAELAAAMSRAEVNIRGPVPLPGGTTEPQVLLDVAGQSAGTLAAVVAADGSTQAAYIAETGNLVVLPPDRSDRLATVPVDGVAHTIDAGAPLGTYRAIAEEPEGAPGVHVVIALPLAGVERSTTELGVTIAVVALAGLVLALAAGSLIVRRALAALARVTDTALQVSELPLARGDVDLDERVPVDDPRTEVGRLGTAFNRMLGHVASALSAREDSERKVRRFVADASHELRTPLASIRGYAELTRLHGGDLPDDVEHAIGRIESESIRMTELVEDLLLLARLDEGRELDLRPVDLGALVRDAIADARVAGPDHTWSVRLPDGAREVVGDDARLRQVLANLLANARLHTPAGTHVEVALEPAGDGLRLAVTDDGPGIEPSVRDTLFERFARGDASRSRRAGSTGLGLAIVRAVVEAHHGTVAVESDPGRTVFTVDLPAAPTGRTLAVVE